MRQTRIWVAFVLAIACATLGALASTSSGIELSKRAWPEPEPSEFSALLVLSDNPDQVLRGWKTRTMRLPRGTTRTIERGRPIVAFVYFTGCEPDADGLCNATVDFTILRPDGSVYESFESRDLWRHKPAPPEGTMGLAAEHVGAVIEPSDPLGRYEFRVTVHDLNGGTSLDLKQAFTATD